MKTYKLRGTLVNVSVGKYGNKRPAILIKDADGMPYMTATINVASDSPVILEDVVIKDYSENEGIYQWLVDRNIIFSAYAKISLPHGNWAPVCVLNPEEMWKDEMNVLENVDDYLD